MNVVTKLPEISRISTRTSYQNEIQKKSASVFGIPSALPRRKPQMVDIYFEKRKEALSAKLPILTAEEIKRYRLPHRDFMLKELTDKGHVDVAVELQDIFRKEEEDAALSTPETLLTENRPLLEFYAAKLCTCSDLVRRRKVCTAIRIRQHLAEELLENGLQLWLAKHFYTSCIKLCGSLECDELRGHFSSEIYCILGYLEFQDGEDDDLTLERATTYLKHASEMSKNQEEWKFQSKVLVFKLKRPVYLYGLRQEFESIDARSMTVYSVSNLLLYQAHVTKASSLIFSKSTESDVMNTTYDSAVTALKMARESNNHTAVSCASMTLGAVHLKRGELQQALSFFYQFERNAEIHKDYESQAIALNLKGCTYIGLQDTLNALENFVSQKEKADELDQIDLKIDALQYIGQVLLSEGQTLEAEQCFHEVQEDLKSIENRDIALNFQDTVDNAWVRRAISSGLHLWGRMAGHCRTTEHSDMLQVNKWKGYRRPMNSVQHEQRISVVSDFFENYSHSQVEIKTSPAELFKFFEKNKQLIGAVISEDDNLLEENVEEAIAKLQAELGRSVLAQAPHRVANAYCTLYESDLRGGVRKIGSQYEYGGSLWTLDLGKSGECQSSSIMAVAEDLEGSVMKKASEFQRRPARTRNEDTVRLHTAGLAGHRKDSADTDSKLKRVKTVITAVRNWSSMTRDSLWGMSKTSTLHAMNRLGGKNEYQQSKVLLKLNNY